MNKTLETMLAVGQTVTDAVLDAAGKAKLPEAAMAELWKGRTINRRALEAIKAAVAADKPAAKKKGGE